MFVRSVKIWPVTRRAKRSKGRLTGQRVINPDDVFRKQDSDSLTMEDRTFLIEKSNGLFSVPIGLFGSNNLQVPLCIYCEKERYYEFFSGKEVVLQSSDMPPRRIIFFKEAPDTKCGCIYLRYCSAGQFAETVKPFMRYQSKIVKAIEKRIEDDKKERMMRSEEQQKREKMDKAAESWLDSILKNR